MGGESKSGGFTLGSFGLLKTDVNWSWRLSAILLGSLMIVPSELNSMLMLDLILDIDLACLTTSAERAARYVRGDQTASGKIWHNYIEVYFEKGPFYPVLFDVYFGKRTILSSAF